jgi:D-alanyl-D-alanine carboxypeptidase
VLDSLVRATPAIPGVAVTVLAPRACLTWHGAAGVADRGTRQPLTPRHPHRIASNTKTYTGAAILRLMEQGRLALDDPITRHLSSDELAPLRRDGYAVDRITVRHLLHHTAGLYDYATDERFVAIVTTTPTHRWTRAEQVDSAMVWGDAYGAPGAVFHYTDTGYILLGRIIERLSGMGLAEAYRALLRYDALGLTATWLETLEPAPAGVAPRAHQYLGEQDTFAFDPSFDLYGGGGLVATTGDMARFTQALFAGGVFERPGTIDTMRTLPVGLEAARTYALGISRIALGGDELWGHTGFWNTSAHHVPARDVTVAASITQQGNGAAMRALVQRVLALVPR